jgi:hypothetical protein
MKKNRRNDRLVLAWIEMGTALVLLITAIVNAVFNYQPTDASEVVAPL